MCSIVKALTAYNNVMLSCLDSALTSSRLGPVLGQSRQQRPAGVELSAPEAGVPGEDSDRGHGLDRHSVVKCEAGTVLTYNTGLIHIPFRETLQ